jgi:hypothetical protein
VAARHQPAALLNPIDNPYEWWNPCSGGVRVTSSSLSAQPKIIFPGEIAMPTQKRRPSKSAKPTVHLIESNDAAPALMLKPGMRFAVHATRIVDAKMRPGKKIAARLCGGTTTCLALVEV